MRTKTLLLGMAALAASMAISKAQPVYSANVVGYVNTATTNNGFVLLNNPVDYDGTGTNDTVVNIFGTNLPVGSKVQTWNPGVGFVIDQYSQFKSGPAWTSPNTQIPPGTGFFVYNPSNNTQTITFVGTVEQGGLTNPFVVGGGFSLISGQFPVAGGITTTYGYQPSIGDKVETWVPPANGYTINQYSAFKSGPAWSAGEPQIGPGIGVFLYTTNLNPVMGTNFVVQ